MEKAINGNYVGSAETPINIVYDQTQCIGDWGTQDFIVNGDFEQNKCTAAYCKYSATDFIDAIPGWTYFPAI